MATTALTINMEEDTLREHIGTLIEKLEAIRVGRGGGGGAGGGGGGLSKKYRQPVQVEIRTLEFWRSIISECLATFFFVFIVSGASCSYLGKGIDKANDLMLSTAFATGLSMSLLHHCFEKISGGHVNPAVTLAMAVTKKISPLRAALFVVAQCGGGVAGAALLYGVAPGLYPINSSNSLGPWERFGVEMVLTFIVVFAFFSKLEKKLFNNGSMVIGVAYAACTLAGMPMLNPARALGPAFVMNKLWDNHWVFWFGPILGGVLAAIIHEFIFNSNRHGKRPTDSIDGDSSIHSDDERFDDNKYHPTAYRPVGSGNPNSPGGVYCQSVASTSLYNTPPGRPDRGSGPCSNGTKYKQSSSSPAHGDGVYGGTRSLYGGKTSEGIYSGTKSMYTKSPPLTRANLNRSQSVYSKSQNPRDLLPKPGPLIPAQSLYPIKLGNGGHFTANVRDFGSPGSNFIAGIKTNDGNYIKVPPGSDQTTGSGFNQNVVTFPPVGRNVTSRSYHDVTDCQEKSPFQQQQQQQQQQNYSVGDHLTNQNVQNQHLLNLKPEKNPGENIYGIRNVPTGCLYPGGTESGRPGQETGPKREVQGKQREVYDLPRGGGGGGHDSRSETPRSQASSSFNRTAAYVKSVQAGTNAGYKGRDSNYDIVPSGIREVTGYGQKMAHNRADATSDYGSNSLTNQFSE